MQNKIYYHNLNNGADVELAHCFDDTTITIFSSDINKGYISHLDLKPYGYYLLGDPLLLGIEIYYDTSTSSYHIIKKANSYPRYITLYSKDVRAHGSGLLSGKAQTINVSNMTKLEQLNILNYPIISQEINKEANETMEYDSINNNNQYQSFSSLIIINARNSQGVWGSGVYLLTKVNLNSSQSYSLVPIAETNAISQFNLTANERGFTASSSYYTRYKIT